VVALEVNGVLDIEPVLPGQAADGSIALPAADAICHGKKIKYECGHKRNNIGFWLDSNDWIEWQFAISRPGKFTVSAELAGTASSQLELIAGKEKLQAATPKTGDFGRFQRATLGTIDIPAGKASLAVKAVKQGWRPVNVKSVTLKPAK
jgi:hypothetical protein